jgi:hypothetical protein
VAALAQARYVYTALHENLHLATQGWYSDEDLARDGHVPGSAEVIFPISQMFRAWVDNASHRLSLLDST